MDHANHPGSGAVAGGSGGARSLGFRGKVRSRQSRLGHGTEEETPDGHFDVGSGATTVSLTDVGSGCSTRSLTPIGSEMHLPLGPSSPFSDLVLGFAPRTSDASGAQSDPAGPNTDGYSGFDPIKTMQSPWVFSHQSDPEHRFWSHLKTPLIEQVGRTSPHDCEVSVKNIMMVCRVRGKVQNIRSRWLYLING